ncbi:MAG: septum formation initiator family protein [Phycisphaerae bacterium]
MGSAFWRGDAPPAVAAAPASGKLVFWLLALMGVSTFVPCVLLPQWRQYQALSVAEQTAQHRLDVLHGRIEQETRLLEALRSDPAVVARFARRDLGFHRANERVVRFSAPLVPAARADRFTPSPVAPPPVLARLASYLPDYNYDAVFCEDDTRPIIMALSLGLIAAAYVLLGRRRA